MKLYQVESPHGTFTQQLDDEDATRLKDQGYKLKAVGEPKLVKHNATTNSEGVVGASEPAKK